MKWKIIAARADGAHRDRMYLHALTHHLHWIAIVVRTSTDLVSVQ